MHCTYASSDVPKLMPVMSSVRPSPSSTSFCSTRRRHIRNIRKRKKQKNDNKEEGITKTMQTINNQSTKKQYTSNNMHIKKTQVESECRQNYHIVLLGVELSFATHSSSVTVPFCTRSTSSGGSLFRFYQNKNKQRTLRQAEAEQMYNTKTHLHIMHIHITPHSHTHTHEQMS